MQIAVTARIPFPRSLVFETYRDRLTDLVPYMPNIRGAQVRRRELQEDNRLVCINEWQGGGDIPAAARAILDESMLAWTEYATWDTAHFTSDWEIQTHAYTEAVRCLGQNRFLADGNDTIVESRGDLSIDSGKIAGVPHFVASMISGIVEDLLRKKIGPNLLQMSDGVRLYLEDQHLNLLQR